MYCNLDKAIFEGAGQFDFPIIKPFTEDIHIDKWLGFNYIKSFDCNNKIGCHFFLDDYQFETLWDFPNKYIDKLKSCGAVISTDFSVYTDFPKAIQIYNIYRNCWLARFYQNKGVKIIPNVTWSIDGDYNWQLDAYPKNSIIAVSTKTCWKNEKNRKYFYNGFEEMIKRLNPIKILCFTTSDKDLKLSDNVEYIQMRLFGK